MKFVFGQLQLTIQFEGFEQVWALKRRLQIPKHAIASVQFMPQQPAVQDYEGHLRFPGTSVPTFFRAGSYHNRQHREFWYVKMRRPGVVTITMHPESLHYDTIRLTCSPEVAQSIADWWQERA